MSIDTAKINDFFSKITLEQIYNGGVIFVISLILILASFALFRPINHIQLNNVVQLSLQHSLPQTQDLAMNLVQQGEIYRAQYLKLMQAYQQESQRAHQLPPMDGEQP